MSSVVVHWFRRDLRLEDNAALLEALSSGMQVRGLFIFDKSILGKLEDKDDRRVYFLYQRLLSLKSRLEEQGATLHIRYGHVEDVWKELIKSWAPVAVYTNEDYEPYARARDEKMKELFGGSQIQFHLSKDHVLCAKREVVKDDGKPYTVFTPYSRKWRSYIESNPVRDYRSEDKLEGFKKEAAADIPSLAEMGFETSAGAFPEQEVENEIIKHYADKRDIPGIRGTSRLGVHLRFGTISIRRLYHQARVLSDTFVNELIWRDFYQMVLWWFPRTEHESFRVAYDEIPWLNEEDKFRRWQNGTTGYALVDAGMRELKETGYMHNRVRMLVASFLTKHLLIDWRWGERHFARYLLDFELASNVGGWQWAAGCGTDAAPYFRIFNPHTQLKKFDKDLTYTRRWIPEYDSIEYASNLIVDHKMARERALKVYKTTLDNYKSKNS